MKLLVLVILSIVTLCYAATPTPTAIPKATIASFTDKQFGPLFMDGADPQRSHRFDRMYVPAFNIHAPRWVKSGDYIGIVSAVNGTGTIFAASAYGRYVPDAVLAAAGQLGWHSPHAIHALDFVEGTVLWNVTLPLRSDVSTSRPTSPILLGLSGGVDDWLTSRVVTGTADGGVYVLNSDNGKMIYNGTIEETVASMPTSSAVTKIIGSQDRFMVRTMRTVSCFNFQDTATYDKVNRVWTKPIDDVYKATNEGQYGTLNSDEPSLFIDRTSDFISGIMTCGYNCDVVFVVSRNVTQNGFMPNTPTMPKYKVNTQLRALYAGDGSEASWSPITSSLTMMEPCFDTNNNIVYVPTAEGRAFAYNVSNGSPMWGPAGIDVTNGGFGAPSFQGLSRHCTIRYFAALKQDVVFFSARFNDRWMMMPVTKNGFPNQQFTEEQVFPLSGETWYEDKNRGLSSSITMQQDSQLMVSGRSDSSDRVIATAPDNRAMARRVSYDAQTNGPVAISVNALWQNTQNMQYGVTPLYPEAAPAVGPWGSLIGPYQETSNTQCNPCISNFHGLVYVGCPKFSMGTACEQCMDGYFSLDGACNECPNYGVGLYVAAILAFILLVILLAKFGSAPSLGPITQFVNFAQIVGVLSVMQFSWPQSVRNLLNWFSFLNFNIDAAGPECTSGLSFMKNWNIKYLIMMMIPVVYYALIGLGMLIGRWTKKRKIILAMKRAALMFARLAFLPYVVKTLQYFDCTKRSGAGVNNSALWTFDAYPSINCFEGEWFQWIASVIPGIVFCIGTFIIIFKKTKVDAKSNSADPEEFEQVYGSLYARYHTKFKWWELTVLIRKGWIAVVGLMAATNTNVSSILSMVVLIVSVFGTFIYQPFYEKRHQVLESVLVGGNLLTIIAAIVSSAFGDSIKDGSVGAMALLAVVALILGGALLAVVVVLILEMKKGKKEGKVAGKDNFKDVQLEPKPTDHDIEAVPAPSTATAAISDDDTALKRRYTMRRRNSFTLYNELAAGNISLETAEIPPGYLPCTAGSVVSHSPFRASWIAMFIGLVCSALVLAGWAIRSADNRESATSLTMGLVIPGVALCVLPLMLISWGSISLRSFVDHPGVVGLPKMRHFAYVIGVVVYGWAFFVSGRAGDRFENDSSGLNLTKVVAYIWGAAYFLLCIIFYIDFITVIKQIRAEWRGILSSIKRLTINAGTSGANELE